MSDKNALEFPDTRAVTAPPRPIEVILSELRPRLHRYCARMTGSVIDGEDIVQATILKALEAERQQPEIANPEGWLFRIAHNAALDFLRRRTREDALFAAEEPDMIATDTAQFEDRQVVATCLREFAHLPVSQRSSVILADVLGHSLKEISEIVGGSVPAAKAALQRGRARLRAMASEPDDTPLPSLDDGERTRLQHYVDRFNAHDFDAVRAMLAEDVQLEVVGRLRLDGKASVSPYFGNYAIRPYWKLMMGVVDGRPAILGYDAEDPDQRARYFILLAWKDGKISGIRDFVLARYVMDGAEIARIDP